MVRGNWQRRVERTEARRTAAKLQKESRRNKRAGGGGTGDYKAHYRSLTQWLEEKCGAMTSVTHYTETDRPPGVETNDTGQGYVIMDIWTDARPESRQEYILDSSFGGDEVCDDDDDDFGKGKSPKGKNRTKEKDNARGGPKKSKGKSHPNSRARSNSIEDSANQSMKDADGSSTSQQDVNKLCGQEFFFGMENCNKCQNQQSKSNKQQKRRGGAGICPYHHYHQFPKRSKNKGKDTNGVPHTPPMTLCQVVKAEFIRKDQNDATSLPAAVADAVLKLSFAAATSSRSLAVSSASATGEVGNASSDGAALSSSEPPNDSKNAASMEVVYHSRKFVPISVGAESSTGTEDEKNDEREDDVLPDREDEAHNRRNRSNTFDSTRSDRRDRSDTFDSTRGGRRERSDTFESSRSDRRSRSNTFDSTQSNDDEHSNVVNVIARELQNLFLVEKMSTNSLIYLTIQGVLIYDRNRGGLVISDGEENYLLFGEPIEVSDIENVVSSAIDGTRAEQLTSESLRIHEELTHVLDEILSYLDDEAVGALPRVCKSWYNEIGTHSPQLWKMLLDRRGWLSDLNNLMDVECSKNGEIGVVEGSNKIDEFQLYRETFISHYTAIRNARAIKMSCEYLLSSNNSTGNINAKNRKGVEYASQYFKATKGAPNFDNNSKNISVVKAWTNVSDATSRKIRARALAAYPHDCSLRLFEAAAGTYGNASAHPTTSNATPMINRLKCRQIVSARAAPPSISRKKNKCELVGMDLDDNVVASLIEECGENTEGDNGDDVGGSTIPWITAIHREELVCAGNEGIIDDSCIQSFNLRAATLDFVMGGSVGSDHSFDELRVPLHDYIAIFDGDTSAITVSVTPKLVACGNGHFLFHAFIAIPQYTELPFDDVGDEDDVNRIHPQSAGNRVFLFSIQKGFIVKSFHLDAQPWDVNLFSSQPFSQSRNSHTASALCTNVLVFVGSSPSLICVKIYRNGLSELSQTPFSDRDALTPFSRLFAIVTSSDVILVSNTSGPESICSLQCRKAWHSQDEAIRSVALGGRGCTMQNLFLMGEYAIAFVSVESPLTNNEGEVNEEEEGFDGHWFGANAVSNELILVYIPTFKEIYRCSFPNNNIPISFHAASRTLAINVSSFGFVISGGDARDVLANFSNEADTANAALSSPAGKAPKGKKKRLASKTAKKDGFARGMTMRG